MESVEGEGSIRSSWHTLLEAYDQHNSRSRILQAYQDDIGKL